MIIYKNSPTCAVVTFRKDRRKSNFAQFGFTRLNIQKKRSPVEMQNSAHWNLISCSINVPPLVLSSISILPAPSFCIAFIPSWKT